MFGFGRRRAIRKRAKSLGEFMLMQVNWISSMSLDELIEANRREGFVDNYIETESFTKGRKYDFFESEPDNADFSFHVTYENTGGRMLIAEGHRNYFGLVLSGSSDVQQIGVNMKELLTPSEYARDARALQAALLKFPGFQR